MQDRSLIDKFNLKGVVREPKNWTTRLVLLRIAFVIVSFVIGSIFGQTINYFLYPHIGNWCILASLVLGAIILKPLTRYFGELEYRLYLKWI